MTAPLPGIETVKKQFTTEAQRPQRPEFFTAEDAEKRRGRRAFLSSAFSAKTPRSLRLLWSPAARAGATPTRA